MSTDIEARLTAQLERFAGRAARRRAALPTPQVRVESPQGVFTFGDTELPFAGASIGKLATAALAMQLVEQGRWNVDTPLASLLPAEELRGLFTHRGVDQAGRVTIEHVLSHRAGLRDVFEDRLQGGRSLRDRVRDDPDRFWSPDELLELARGAELLAEPGARFHYSDTGYVLAARALEAATGRELHDLVHERIFDPLGMRRSWYVCRSSPADGATDLAPAYLGGIEVSRAQGFSVDWGGGGVIGSPADFARFARGLCDGTLMSAESWAFLTRPRSRARFGMRYGASVWTLRMRSLAPFSGRLPDPVGAMGATGTHVWIVPEFDAVIVMNLHADRELAPAFVPLTRILQALRDAHTAGVAGGVGCSFGNHLANRQAKIADSAAEARGLADR